MKDKYLLILLVINLVFFLPYIASSQLLTELDNDLGRTYIPTYSFIKETFQNYKQIPLWNPNQMMGDTFIGNPLSSLFYPLNIIFILLPIKIAAIFFLLIHFSIASFSTFFLAKTFGLSNTVSLAAAIFFAFSTKMLVHLEAGHITMIASFSYFPLFFLSIRKLLTKSTFSYVVLGAVAATSMFITYLTIFYYATIFVIVYVTYKLFEVRRPRVLIKKLTPHLSLALIAFGFSAVALLPQIEYSQFSTRSALKFEDVALPLFSLNTYVRSLIFPYQNLTEFGHETFLYLGVVPLIFSAIGVFHLKRNQKIIVITFALMTLLFVAGQSTPVFKAAYDYLPFLKYSRITTRIWFVVALVSALLAAYGLSKLKNPKIVYLAIIIFLAESIFIFKTRIHALQLLNFEDESVYQFLASDRDIFRVYCTTYCFNPQLLSEYKIEQFSGETPIQNKNFIDFLQKAGNYKFDDFAVIFPPYQVWQAENPPSQNSKLLGEANVKYVVSTYGIENEKLEFRKKFDSFYIYENKDFQRRFRFDSSSNFVNVGKATPNYIDLSFKAESSPQTLIISQNYYPGWYVQIDGAKYEIEKYNDVFQKVVIPQNQEDAQIRFEPRTLVGGKAVTFSTILFLLIFWYSKKQKT